MARHFSDRKSVTPERAGGEAECRVRSNSREGWVYRRSSGPTRLCLSGTGRKASCPTRSGGKDREAAGFWRVCRGSQTITYECSPIARSSLTGPSFRGCRSYRYNDKFARRGTLNLTAPPNYHYSQATFGTNSWVTELGLYLPNSCHRKSNVDVGVGHRL